MSYISFLTFSILALLSLTSAGPLAKRGKSFPTPEAHHCLNTCLSLLLIPTHFCLIANPTVEDYNTIGLYKQFTSAAYCPLNYSPDDGPDTVLTCEVSGNCPDAGGALTVRKFITYKSSHSYTEPRVDVSIDPNTMLVVMSPWTRCTNSSSSHFVAPQIVTRRRHWRVLRGTAWRIFNPQLAQRCLNGAPDARCPPANCWPGRK
jgi:hypothetical protein